MLLPMLVMAEFPASSPTINGHQHPVAVITSLEQRFDLNPYIETIEDVQHEYTLENIQAGTYDHLWQRNTQRYFIGKNNKSKYWFRLTIDWHGQAPVSSILYIDSQHGLLSRIGLVIPNTSGMYHQVKAGFLEPYITREGASPQFGFKLPLITAGPQTLFGWVNNTENGVLPLLPLYLVSEIGYDKIQNQVVLVLVGFYAVMAALWFYNVCLFVMLREPVYGLYIIFLASAVLTCVTTDGVGHQWLWPNTPRMSLRISTVTGIVGLMVYLAFILQSLNGAPFWPRFKILYLILMGVGCGALLHNLFATEFDLSNVIVQAYPAFVFPVTLVLIIAAVWKKQPTAGYLLIAEVMTLAGAVSFMLLMQGLVPINIVTFWGLHWGFLGEVMLLSLAVAARTNIIIQDKLQAQHSAIQHLENYEALYEDSVEGRFQYSVKSHFAKCNLAMAKLCGYESVAAFMADKRITHLADEATNKKITAILLSQGIVSGFETKIIHQITQQPVWVSINMRLMNDDNGQPEYVEGSVVNISERKLKEHAEKDKEISDAKNQAKSQFFASMSHELRTPLTAILGYADIAKRDELSEQERKEHIKTIEHSSQHLLQLVNDILDLSKIEAQKLEMEQLDVNVLSILSDVMDFFSILAFNKGISFSIDYQFPLPATITSDPTRLKQTLINICGNAIKFTEQGGVTVTVSCDKEPLRMNFAVQDTGIGLSPDQVGRLFGAFAQADASTTRNFGGTGLGLHLSKQIAEKLGGDIAVESERGKGSIFTLTIATGSLANVTWLEALPKPERDAVIDNIMIPQLTGHVLYAEDNPHNQKLVATFVKKTGATIDVVSNGRKALEIVKEKHFDLIFTDIRMPELDGVEFTKALLQANPDLPIIAITATATNQEIVEFKAVGFKKILRKPIDRKMLYETMSGYLVQQEPTQGQLIEQKTSVIQAPEKENGAVRVLLADDNPVNQQLIAFHIKHAGAQAVIVNDGAEALAEAIKGQFDLILMDMQMPTMDGMTAVRYIREKGFTNPIYALTANESAEAIHACVNAGCDGHLSKPLNTAKLNEVIRSLKVHN